MHTGRLEAFSDGVFAIIITIMVLTLKVPHEPTLAALRPQVPELLSYVMSFLYVGIYWNNHHHVFQATEKITGGALWANLHLLFWLSIVPLVTDWIGATNFAPVPVALYGVNLLLAAVAFTILMQFLLRANGRDSVLARALGHDWKGKTSIAFYVLGIAVACYAPKIACVVYTVVALIWFIPDRRIERQVITP